MQASHFINLTAMLSLPTNAVASEPPPLTASSKWQMDYSKEECRLLRSFGEGPNRVTLQLSQDDPEPSISFSLSAPNIPATDTRKAAVIRTATSTIRTLAQGVAAQPGVPAILEVQSSDELYRDIADQAKMKQPTRLGISFVRGWSLDLDLGQMGTALAAMDRCVDNLVKSWGLDPAEQRARRMGPKPVNPRSWFKPEDFPSAHHRVGAGGVVMIRLGVAAKGTVSDCEVAKASGDEAYRDVTCRLLKQRARFIPARGAGGQPIASFWTLRVRWQGGPRTFHTLYL